MASHTGSSYNNGYTPLLGDIALFEYDPSARLGLHRTKLGRRSRLGIRFRLEQRTSELGQSTAARCLQEALKLMTRMKGTVFRIAAIGCLLSPSMYGCARPASNERTVSGTTSKEVVPDTAAVRQFVQRFYDWYAPVAAGDSRHPTYWATLNGRGLDRVLAEALRSDSIASARADETRELFNADPFLWSQDPCTPYAVDKVDVSNTGFRVTVVAICRLPPSNRPILDVRPAGTSFEIVNVFYGNEDLRSLLCGYAKADKRPERRPKECS